MDHPSPDQFAEARRLQALYALDILDTGPEKKFNALVSLARQVLDTPVVLVTLLDRYRVWVKAGEGIEVEESPREICFCNHTIQGSDIFEVTDAAADRRFADNPFVIEDPKIRFYAGMPIHASDVDEPNTRHAIGAICGIDYKPRKLNEQQRDALRHLGQLAEALIAAHGATREALRIADTANLQAVELRRREQTFRAAERMTQIGSWRYVLSDASIIWSEGVYRIHELDSDQQLGIEEAISFYPPHAREQVRTAIGAAARTGASFDLEVDFITAKGRQRRVRTVGGVEMENGEPVALTGVFQDITERYLMEQSLRRSANRDEVTGVANRSAFNRELRTAMHAARTEPTPLALMLIDLDGFKQVNDVNGHIAGDDVLRAVGRRLGSAWLNDSFAARLGGDEFALIVRDPALCEDIDNVVERLIDQLRMPVLSGNTTLPVSGTIGYALYEPGIGSVRDFMHRADTALYEAKRIERGTARRFSARCEHPALTAEVAG